MVLHSKELPARSARDRPGCERRIEQCVDCERIGLMVAGLEVPHTHVHLVPISSVGDLNFAHATETPPGELAELAGKIRGVLG